MDKMELKEILSNFDSKSGGQLKVYLAMSLFPNIDTEDLAYISGISMTNRTRIINAVKEKGLVPLKFDNSNESNNSDELASLCAELQHQRKALDEAAEENQNLTKEAEAYSAKVAQLQTELDKFRDEWEKDFFKRADTETTLRNEVARLTKERDDWKATAKICKQEAEDYKRKLDGAGRERNPLLDGLI